MRDPHFSLRRVLYSNQNMQSQISSLFEKERGVGMEWQRDLQLSGLHIRIVHKTCMTQNFLFMTHQNRYDTEIPIHDQLEPCIIPKFLFMTHQNRYDTEILIHDPSESV